jgi:Ion channel
MLFFHLAIAFLKEFAFALWLACPLLLSLAAVITAIVQVVGKKEQWSAFDSFFWSFITATTVGILTKLTQGTFNQPSFICMRGSRATR